MDIDSLRAMSRSDAIREAARFASVSPSVFTGMANTESSGGVNMTSPKGARGWFGLMPKTQATIEQRTGLKLNPDDFTDGLFMAAHVMRENMQHFGNVEDSLRAYNGSWDRKNWNNEETQAYVGKVLGTDHAALHASNQKAMNYAKEMNLEQLMALTPEQRLYTAPQDILKDRTKQPTQAERVHALLPVGEGPDKNDSLRPEARAEEVASQVDKQRTAAFNAKTPYQKFEATLMDNTATAAIIRGFQREHNEEDPNFTQSYVDTWQEREAFASSQADVDYVRQATSDPDYWRRRKELEDHHTREFTYGGGGSTERVLWSLAGGAADPVGLALGLGVGKGLEVAGIGSRVLMAGRLAREAGEETVYTRALLSDPAGQYRAGDLIPKYREVETIVGHEPIPEFKEPPPMSGYKGSWGWKTEPGTPVLPTRPIISTQSVPVTKAISAVEGVTQNHTLGVASLLAEQAITNTALTGIMDASGENVSISDYGWAAGSGMVLAGVMAPLHLLGARSVHLEQFGEHLKAAAAEEQGIRYARASEELGPDATKEELNAKVQSYERTAVRDTVMASLAEVPNEHRLLPQDKVDLITSDPVKAKDIHDRYDLAAISDDADRALVAEHIAQGERILADNPINDKGLKTILQKATAGSAEGQGMESTGLTLLNSKSPTARAVSMMLLEGTTGAGGRRRTAAMSMAVRERLYLQQTREVDGLFHMWRKANGYHIATEHVTGAGKQEFNKRVYEAMNARQHGVGKMEGDPLINQAADLYEKGFDLMRVEQQHVGTAGADRLGTSSVGYVPRRFNVRELLGLTHEQRKGIRSIFSDQFVDEQNGFDREFADWLSAKYMEVGMGKGRGAYDLPVNIHDPQAADIIQTVMDGLSASEADKKTLLGKFARGGATHTKNRLRLDTTTPIPDADGIVRNKRLSDLYVQDMDSLYRSYARRTAGEVALGQYGIMGNKGLKVLRKAMESDGASNAELKAFDQVAAEFLNTPFGAHDHKYMDNMRLAATIARLGGMGITQLAEYGNGIGALGVHAVFQSIGDIPRLMKEVGQLKKGGKVRGILESLETLGGEFGMDDFNVSRLVDAKESGVKLYGTDNLSVLDRALRAGAHANSILSGHRIMLAVQVRGMAEQVVRKAVKMAARGGEDVHLADMGIHGELLAKLREDLPNIAEFKGDKLTNLDFSKAKALDPSSIMELRDAVERGASQIIQRTYVGETGRWAHDGFIKLLAQFRTFGITSIEKQWGRNMAAFGGAKTAAILAGSMAFAMPIAFARAHLKMAGMSRSDRDKYAKANLNPWALGRTTMNYMSATGLLGDFLDVGNGFIGGLGGDAGRGYAETVGARGASKAQLLGGVLGPSMGLAEDVWSGVHGKNPHKLLGLVPGAGLPYVQPFLTGMIGNKEDAPH